MQTLFLLFCVLNIADIYTTLRALRLGGREANPIMAKLMDKIGALPALLAIKVPTALVAWFSLDDPLVVYVLPAACAFYTWVVARNQNAIKRLQAREL